jgi:hypothetical protein
MRRVRATLIPALVVDRLSPTPSSMDACAPGNGFPRRAVSRWNSKYRESRSSLHMNSCGPRAIWKRRLARGRASHKRSLITPCHHQRECGELLNETPNSRLEPYRIGQRNCSESQLHSPGYLAMEPFEWACWRSITFRVTYGEN